MILKPTAKDLEILMNTVSYFMFSKEKHYVWVH